MEYICVERERERVSYKDKHAALDSAPPSRLTEGARGCRRLCIREEHKGWRDRRVIVFLFVEKDFILMFWIKM